MRPSSHIGSLVSESLKILSENGAKSLENNENYIKLTKKTVKTLVKNIPIKKVKHKHYNLCYLHLLIIHTSSFCISYIL